MRVFYMCFVVCMMSCAQFGEREYVKVLDLGLGFDLSKIKTDCNCVLDVFQNNKDIKEVKFFGDTLVTFKIRDVVIKDSVYYYTFEVVDNSINSIKVMKVLEIGGFYYDEGVVLQECYNPASPSVR